MLFKVVQGAAVKLPFLNIKNKRKKFIFKIFISTEREKNLLRSLATSLIAELKKKFLIVKKFDAISEIVNKS